MKQDKTDRRSQRTHRLVNAAMLELLFEKQYDGITVQDILEYLAGGMSETEILEDFPELTATDIRACLAFAADRERQLAVLPQYEVTV